MMMRWTLPICYCLLAPCLVAGASNKVAFSKEYMKEFLTENTPPIEVDMQLDFEIGPTSNNKKKKKKKKKKKPRPSARTAATPSRTPPPPRRLPPPPPPPRPVATVAATPRVAPVVVTTIKKSPRKTASLTHLNFTEAKLRLHKATGQVFEHKYASIVWASLLFVWAPLLFIFIVNKSMGKEAFIDVLVNILPESFPARYIELVIEDGLWVGIFGASIVATIGTFLVEMATLGMDIGKSLASDSQSTKISRRKQ